MLRSRIIRLLPPVVTIAAVVVLAAPASAATAAHWALNEPPGSTTMVDDSGHNNNGTLQNVAANAGFYSFNGTSSRVVVRDNPNGSLDPGTTDFTYGVRVRTTVVPDDAVGDYDLLRKGLGSTKGGYFKVELFPNASNTKARALCQAQGTKGAAKLVGSTNLADGAWHTITCEKKPSAFNLYVDGALKATKPNTIGSIANAAALTLGAKDIGGDWFRGDMNDATLSIG
jgi:concanavalin A-like lectin/glucanase superfamily protein